MGGELAINPNGDVKGPKLSEMIAAGEVKEKKEKEDDGHMMLLCFKINPGYLRTIPGFLRLVKILLLFVAFICMMTVGDYGDNSGVFVVNILVLLVATIVATVFLFARLMGSTGGCCGFSWVFLDFLNYAAIGFLVFLLACITASKSEGNTSINGAAAFGILASLAYGYLCWHGWGAYRSSSSEEKSVKTEKTDEEKGNMTEDEEVGNEEEFEVKIVDENEKIPTSMKNRSLPTNLDHMYENTQTKHFSRHASQRKRQSLSEKDSAYSEGEDLRDETPPHQRRMSHHQRRRSRSGGIEGVLSRQPLAHMSHKNYSRRFDRSLDGSRDSLERSTVGYPSMFDQPKSRTLDPSSNRRSHKRNKMPDWLKAALGDDVINPHQMDDEEEEGEFRRRPTAEELHQRREFPLLNDSEAEESVCYPSISQMHSDGRHLVPNPMRRSQRRVSRTRTHGQRRRRSHSNDPNRIRRHQSRTLQSQQGRRRSHRGNHRHHGNHHVGNHRGATWHHRRGGNRRGIDSNHEAYLRHVIGDDELVQQRGKPQGERNEGERSNSPVPNGMDNPVMQKYFNTIK